MSMIKERYSFKGAKLIALKLCYFVTQKLLRGVICMAKRRVSKAKSRSVRRVQKSYDFIQGNTNEFLLMFGGGAFVLFSVIYLIKTWW